MELLPIVTLSTRGDLKLKGYNQAAARELDLAATAGNSPFRAAEWLRRPGQREPAKLEEGAATDLLEALARESSRCPWGQGVLLHFWSNSAPASAEVVVSHASANGTIEIVFLRPRDMPSLSSPDPLVSLVPESRFSSRVPPPPPPPDRPAEPAIGSILPSSLLLKGKLNNGDAASETSRSASFSSGQSTSASTRRTSRPTVGAERRNLPLSPEFTSMLAHATSRLTDPGNHTFSTETRQTSPIDGRPPPPWARSTESDEGTARLEEKLPHSVGVLVGRRKSFDRGIEVLSDNTDRSAGRPLPFRVPTQDERDAHDLRSVGSMEGTPQPTIDTPDTEMASGSKPPSPTPGPSAAARRQALSFGQLADMIETMPVISFMADLNGQVVWLNRAWYRYTGADPDFNMTFEAWMSMFHPDDLQEVLPIYLSAMQSGEPFGFKYRIKRRDGVLRWHACVGAPVRSADGSLESWICNVIDVHEDTETRHDALLVQERIKAVLEGSDISLLTVSPRLEVILFEGKPPLTMTDTTSPCLVGANFAELWPACDLQDAVQRILDGEVERDYVQISEQTEAGQTIHHRCRLLALRGDPAIPQIHPDANAITGCIIVVSDVTELVEAEEALQKSAASEHAAREANRLKTQFLTTITHEIRTPIAGILGICELLLGDSDRLSEDQRSLVQQAIRSADTLLELIGAVLDLRKVEENKLALETGPFLLSEALNDARLFSVIAQKKGLGFVEDIEPFYQGTLLGDRLRLRQVLANALSNAIKFTKAGDITLGCSQLFEDEKRVVVQFEVRDSGIGIDSAVLPTLFEPFRQADPSTAREFGGSGLGLSISKKLVELMDGTISLHSTLGSGSCITVTLSFAKAPLLDVVDFVGTTQDVPPETRKEEIELREVEDQIEHGRREMAPQDVRILLAEDNALIRQIVTRTLKGKGFSIDAVEDGHKCLEQLKNAQYDVVLMDGQMPHLDGYQATKLIRQSSERHIRNLRIIALTASAIKGDRERCLDSGMDAYLAKPVRAAELEAAIWRQVELLGDRRA